MAEYPKPRDEIPPLTLFSEGLLSKWGFSDGDVVDDYLWDWFEDAGLDLMHLDDHALLVQLVKRHLLPVLEQDVEVYVIVTSHNPIRARTVNGEEVDDYALDPAVTLTPEFVNVPAEVVLQAARTIGAIDTTLTALEPPEDPS